MLWVLVFNGYLYLMGTYTPEFMVDPFGIVVIIIIPRFQCRITRFYYANNNNSEYKGPYIKVQDT